MSSTSLPTVKVVNPNKKKEYMIINIADFNRNTHIKWEDRAIKKKPGRPKGSVKPKLKINPKGSFEIKPKEEPEIKKMPEIKKASEVKKTSVKKST